MNRRGFLKQAGAIVGLATVPVGNLLPKSGFGAVSESTPKLEITLQANRKYSEFPGLEILINTGRIDACTQSPCDTSGSMYGLGYGIVEGIASGLVSNG